jgi:hypothetical protein
MRKATLIIGLAVLAVIIALGWQIGSRELANIEFQDDLHDLAAQNAARIGLEAPHNDDELRNIIIQIAAQRYDIYLDPGQVTVRHSGDPPAAVFYFAVDYQARAGLPGFSFMLHFTPTSKK